MTKPTPKRKATLPSEALLERLKREQLEATDERSLMISKRDGIIAKAQAEAELVNKDIADIDRCILLLGGALDKADEPQPDTTPAEIPEFLRQPGNVIKMANGE